MQKLSTRKLSILGLVLLAASAVTAAVLPSKNKDNTAEDCNVPNNGSLTASTGGGNGLTCTETASPTPGSYCHYTATNNDDGAADSSTTRGGALISDSVTADGRATQSGTTCG